MSEAQRHGLIALVLGIVLTFLWFRDRPIQHSPGVLVPDLPVQVSVSKESIALSDVAGHQFEALASINISGRVLSTRRYLTDASAKIAPVDVALGWGPMSDSEILSQLKVRQSGRFYFWSAPQLPLPAKEITRNSSNLHLIPSNDDVRSTIDGLKTGDLVRIEGWLVQVYGPNTFRWRSSLSREDTGNGACEVIYVNSLTRI